MGNAILMPEFYGIGIKKRPASNSNNDAPAEEQKEVKKEEEVKPVEVRKINFRSTYDDYSEFSSYLTDQKDLLLSPATSRVKPGKAQQKELLPKQNMNESLSISKQKSINQDDGVEDTQELQLHSIIDKSQIAHILNSLQAQNQETRSEFDQNSFIKDLSQSISETQSEIQQRFKRCELLLKKGEAELKKGQYKISIKYIEEAMQEISNKRPEHSEQKAELFYLLGVNLDRLTYRERALDFFQQAIQILTHLDKQSNILKMAQINNSIGATYFYMKNFQKSIEHYTKSYILKKSVLPKNSHELALDLNSIALLEVYLGNPKKAAGRYTEALSINLALYGNNHIEVARNYYNLSISFFDAGEYSLWLNYHFESLRIMKELQLQKHPDYQFWLKWFKIKLKQLLSLQNYAKDIVMRSIGMANFIFDQDENIQFLQQIKDDMQKSIIKSSASI